MDMAQKNNGFNTDDLISNYFRLSLPVVLSCIVTIVYNLADTYFIAQTGNALLIAGVSVCAPIFMILMAFGNIFGQGGSSLLSRLLGQQRRSDAGRDRDADDLSLPGFRQSASCSRPLPEPPGNPFCSRFAAPGPFPGIPGNPLLPVHC